MMPYPMQQLGVCMKKMNWDYSISPQTLHKSLYIQLLHKLHSNLHIWFLHQLVQKSTYPNSPQTCTQICISNFSTNLYTNLQRSNHPLKVVVQEAQDKNCLKNQILTTSWANSAQQSLISKWCTKFHFTQILSAIHWNSPTSCGSEWICRPLFWRNSSTKEDSS